MGRIDNTPVALDVFALKPRNCIVEPVRESVVSHDGAIILHRGTRVKGDTECRHLALKTEEMYQEEPEIYPEMIAG